MDLPEANATTAIVGLIGVIASMVSGIAGYLIKREGRIGELSGLVKSMQISVDTLKKDVDGIALYVGTPRAVATNKKEENKP